MASSLKAAAQHGAGRSKPGNAWPPRSNAPAGQMNIPPPGPIITSAALIHLFHRAQHVAGALVRAQDGGVR
jgi:hypothetical protein